MSIVPAINQQSSALDRLSQLFQQSMSPQQSALPLHPVRGDGDWLAEKWKAWQVDALLRDYPGLSVLPCSIGTLIVGGSFTFTGVYDGKEISDTYEIRLEISRHFPRVIPSVFEVGARTPKDFHKLDDGSLCLGSRLRLQLMVATHPTITGFVQHAVIPYLYSYSHKERYGDLPYGDLAHGVSGLIDDYMRIFRVPNRAAAERMVYLTSLQKRKANKQRCPCGSGIRVGKCHHMILNRLRHRLGRLWFRSEYEMLTEKRTWFHKSA
jgi:hypothetical protein